MLTHPTVDRLQQLRCAGMAKARAEQRDSSQVGAVSFEERLGRLVHREITEPHPRQLTNRLRTAPQARRLHRGRRLPASPRPPEAACPLARRATGSANTSASLSAGGPGSGCARSRPRSRTGPAATTTARSTCGYAGFARSPSSAPTAATRSCSARSPRPRSSCSTIGARAVRVAAPARSTGPPAGCSPCAAAPRGDRSGRDVRTGSLGESGPSPGRGRRARGRGRRSLGRKSRASTRWATRCSRCRCTVSSPSTPASWKTTGRMGAPRHQSASSWPLRRGGRGVSRVAAHIGSAPVRRSSAGKVQVSRLSPFIAADATGQRFRARQRQRTGRRLPERRRLEADSAPGRRERAAAPLHARVAVVPPVAGRFQLLLGDPPAVPDAAPHPPLHVVVDHVRQAAELAHAGLRLDHRRRGSRKRSRWSHDRIVDAGIVAGPLTDNTRPSERVNTRTDRTLQDAADHADRLTTEQAPCRQHPRTT